MNLSLLAPAALALGLLVVGPILAHLARRRPRQRVSYGAMLLIRRLQRRLRRRRRLTDLWLLALRVLVLALVVLGLSRPDLSWPRADEQLGGARAVVVVLDDSLSMNMRGDGDETLFLQARREAAALVRGLPEGLPAGLVTIGGRAGARVPQLSADHEALAALIDGITQTQGTTDLAGGLGVARRLLAGGGGAVAVFSDEAGPDTMAATRAELSLYARQHVSLLPHPIQASAPANLVVTQARYGDGLEGGSVRLQVANFGPQEVEAPVVVSLPDGREITAFVQVPAEGEAEDQVTIPRVADGGVGTVRVDDPRLVADNDFSFQLPRVGASRVLVVDGDPGATPTASEVYFLERALAPWGSGASVAGGITPDVTSGGAQLDLDNHRVAFLANVADPAPMANRLVQFVRDGGGLILGLGDNVTAEHYNGPLALLLPSPLRRPSALAAPGEDGVPIALPDTSLALFHPFARGGRVGFTRARFHTLFSLEPYEDSDQVHTLMRLQGGMPLLIERRLGKGRALLFTGSFDLGWGDLPLQAAFMPWVQRMVRYLGGEAGGVGERITAQVGQTVTVNLPDARLDVSVRGPAGPVAAPVRGGAVRFLVDKAGAYRVETPGAPPLALVAVNTDPAESDVRPGPSLVAVAAQVDPARFLHHQPLAPWVLALALLFALAQAALSALRGRPEVDDA